MTFSPAKALRRLAMQPLPSLASDLGVHLPCSCSPRADHFVTGPPYLPADCRTIPAAWNLFLLLLPRVVERQVDRDLLFLLFGISY